MNWILIIFVMWGHGMTEPATAIFQDEGACIKAAMSIFDRVHAVSQTMDPPIVLWGCEAEASNE